jgi:hypothetical protein
MFGSLIWSTFLRDEPVEGFLHQIPQARVRLAMPCAGECKIAQGEHLIGKDIEGVAHALANVRRVHR